MPASDAAAPALASLQAYLRLLWNLAPPLHARGAAAPRLAGDGLLLPEMAAGTRWYQAAAAHAAAHLAYSRHRYDTAGMAPITQALLGLLEDARAEALACAELPGLRALWRPWHTARTDDGDGFDSLLQRLARGLLDARYDDPHPWVAKGRALFAQRMREQGGWRDDPAGLRRLASELGHDLGQMRKALNPRTYRPLPPYRDDNQWLWYQVAAEQPLPRAAPSRPPPAPPPPEAARQWLYPEWDARIRRLRQRWCTVQAFEQPVAAHGPPAVPQALPPAALAAQLRRYAARGWQRQPARDGDAIDLAAAVQASVRLRGQHPADERIYLRRTASATVAAVILVDHSASSSQPAAGPGSQLAAHQQMASALAHAMDAAGWRVAVHGYCSDGRHAVRMGCIKDFGAAWDVQARRRLAALAPGYSTRLGAVLRHATALLAARREALRLCIVLGDGQAHDIDVHEPRYLELDARHALDEARQKDIRPWAISACMTDGHLLDRLWGRGCWAHAASPAALAGAAACLLAG